MKPSAVIWHKGRLVPWEQATVHVLAHALHYGSAIFEGIRAYETPEGPVIFRLNAHLRRLFDSARIYRFEMPHVEEELREACFEVMPANALRSASLRPLVSPAFGSLGVGPIDKCPVEVAIAAFEW